MKGRGRGMLKEVNKTIFDIAKDLDLCTVVVKRLNAFAILGFKNFQDVEALQRRFGGTINEFSSRFGTPFCEHELVTSAEASFCGGDILALNPDFQLEIEFKEEMLSGVAPFFSQELNDTYKRELRERLLNLNEGEVIITDKGMYSQVMSKSPMRYFYDEEFHEIGLMIDDSEAEIVSSRLRAKIKLKKGLKNIIEDKYSTPDQLLPETDEWILQTE